MHTLLIVAGTMPSVFLQGMTGGHGSGVACGHIKVFGLFPFPHQRNIGLQGRQCPTCLNYAGENTACMVSKEVSKEVSNTQRTTVTYL